MNRELNLPEKESILYEDNYIYVLPDICPLVTGHILIISKQHFDSYANASVEVINSVNNFLQIYRANIGHREFTIFEHGSVIHNNGGASIEHAHIHVIPTKLNMKLILNEIIGIPEEISLKELNKFSINKSSYLYLQFSNENKGYAYKVGQIKSQFMRDVVKQLIKTNDEYDWKTGYFTDGSKIKFYKTLAWWNDFKYESSFKWKKKLILEKYGFIAYLPLIEETNRYKKSNLNFVLDLLNIELLCLKENNYIRLVLVPNQYQPKLKNYILRNINDINAIKDFLQTYNEYDEIWYYKGTDFSEKVFAGRLSFDLYNDNFTEIIEIVTGDDPRKLESLTLLNLDVNYLRALRYYAESTYRLDEVRAAQNDISKKELLNFFYILQKKLSTYKKSIDIFSESLFKYAINSFSLEFKTYNDDILFIDWDSSNDSIIIDNEKLL
ncbi:MAG: HIT domain-containing protein [Acutalibacteraceae bacterium]|nr:HIT domain-containing protein [Acutalibacteraceae bacterium]